jgi:hypothetical protein
VIKLFLTKKRNSENLILSSWCVSAEEERLTGTGLPDFFGYNIPKRGKIYQMTINILNDQKYTEWLLNIPNGRKIDQMDVK